MLCYYIRLLTKIYRFSRKSSLNKNSGSQYTYYDYTKPLERCSIENKFTLLFYMNLDEVH